MDHHFFDISEPAFLPKIILDRYRGKTNHSPLHDGAKIVSVGHSDHSEKNAAQPLLIDRFGRPKLAKQNKEIGEIFWNCFTYLNHGYFCVGYP